MEAADGTSERKRISIPRVDTSVLDWWEQQHDVGMSIRVLIRREIERSGYTDIVHGRVEQRLRNDEMLCGRRRAELDRTLLDEPDRRPRYVSWEDVTIGIAGPRVGRTTALVVPASPRRSESGRTQTVTRSPHAVAAARPSATRTKPRPDATPLDETADHPERRPAVLVRADTAYLCQRRCENRTRRVNPAARRHSSAPSRAHPGPWTLGFLPRAHGCSPPARPPARQPRTR
jgi:hypothetical protein